MNTNYVYRKTEKFLWTVGYYVGNDWYPESDRDSIEEASNRCHFLNGGNEKLVEENESLKSINKELLEALKNYTNEVNHGDLKKAKDLYHGLEFILSKHIEQSGL